MNGDQAMRAHSATLPGPVFDNPAWVTPPPLSRSTVAIVTSAALYAAGDEAFGAADTGYRLIERDRRDLVLGHWSPNFDRAGVAVDLNVVYPIDRLEELAARGVIGRVAPQSQAFILAVPLQLILGLLLLVALLPAIFAHYGEAATQAWRALAGLG